MIRIHDIHFAAAHFMHYITPPALEKAAIAKPICQFLSEVSYHTLYHIHFQ